MKLNISPSSGIPIYKQIYEQVQRMIINNQIEVGVLLPSVRQIASELDVNPMTISKAYGLLEERGFLERQRGKGMLVVQRDQRISEQEKLSVLTKMINELVNQAGQMGVETFVLAELFNKEISQQDNKKNIKTMIEKDQE